ncbi:TlpA family protein disulfide reductase [Labilibacter marinus]|uniref:TlpA family protein disulfide reductase n=1 Tax=Labilibacter marinus TaxID=1477105 RepID=UPI00094FDCCA|nr:TlpA disulfide reductase family protein [Labilibacter marinus]
MLLRHIFIALVVMLGLSANAQVVRDFKTNTLSNEVRSFEDLKGDQLTVLDFWASWCRPCIKAMPKLEKVYQEYKDKGVAVVGVNIDGPRSFSKAAPLIHSLKISYTNISDIEGKLKDELEVSSMPTLLIIKGNKVVYRHEGYAAGDEEEWRKKIEKLLAQ